MGHSIHRCSFIIRKTRTILEIIENLYWTQNRDERLKILKMVDAGKKNDSEGALLLESISRERYISCKAGWYPIGSLRWFCVRVTDMVTGKKTTSIPLGLMEWGLRIGAQFAPEVSDIDLEELTLILNSGLEGKIMDVVDQEDGEQVEIFVECAHVV